MQKDELKKYLPFIAGGIALVGAVYYFGSGQSSLNNNVRALEKSSGVHYVESGVSNNVVIKCKNGESYEIVYQDGQTNYQDLVYNKCGEAGTQQ